MLVKGAPDYQSYYLNHLNMVKMVQALQKKKHNYWRLIAHFRDKM